MENKEELLPIGTEVYITDNSEHYSQGMFADGTKKIGKIVEHVSNKYNYNSYIYTVKWNNNYNDCNTYQPCDVEPIEAIKAIKEKNEEELNNELKELFNQILNN